MDMPLSVFLESKGISAAKAALLTKELKPVTFKSNTPLLAQGEHWQDFYIISQGLVRLYYLDSEGKESNKGFFSEGDILAPIAPSAISGPSNFYVETLTEVHGCHMAYAKVVELLKDCSISQCLFHCLTVQLLEDKIERELMFLQQDAKKRYAYFSKKYPTLCQQIPLKHIASYLGMTDVTLSRVKNKH